MKKAGFRMPGGTATVEEAKAWLIAHPDFVAKQAHRAKPKRENGISLL
jgi:hypothetical protein